MLDRLTQTYLEDWDRVSLEFEYWYACEGRVPDRIPHAIMRERVIPASKVTKEIARRTVTGGDDDRHAVDALTQRAQEAIDDGHIDVAAAVFETARRMSPASSELANNHGFCLLPDSPTEALDAFCEARLKGMVGPLLAANIAVAHLQVGRAESALRECEAAAFARLTPTSPALLWEMGEPAGLLPQLISMDPAEYLCMVAQRAARDLNDAQAVARWKIALERLGLAGNGASPKRKWPFAGPSS